MTEPQPKQVIHDSRNGAKMTGHVALFWQHRGYGFIESPDAPGVKVFFHWRDMIDKNAVKVASVGDGVKFTFRMTDRGANAMDVILVQRNGGKA